MFSETSIFAVLLASVAQFVVGAIWYTPVFGELWGKIHGFDKLTKKVQQEMMSQMGPIFALQFAVTVITSMVLVSFRLMYPGYFFQLAALAWAGFVAPTQVSGVLFGGTPSKWIVTKIMLLAGGSFVTLLAGAVVVSMMV